jgi:L-asparagine permease
MIGGWFACRKRIREIAAEREGFTGSAPVIANRPLQREEVN